MAEIQPYIYPLRVLIFNTIALGSTDPCDLLCQSFATGSIINAGKLVNLQFFLKMC